MPRQICDFLRTSFVEAIVCRRDSSLFSGYTTCWLRLETRGENIEDIEAVRRATVFDAKTNYDN
jgi:hypothetical protein